MPSQRKVVDLEGLEAFKDKILEEASQSGSADIKLVSTLPTVGEENAIYLADTNATSQGGVVEIPVPTTLDEGKVFVVDNQGKVALGTRIGDIVELAEGKTANHVISYASNASFNSTQNTISLTISGGSITDVEGNTITLDSLRIGDIVSIIETDVPDRWVGSISGGTIVFYKLETKLNMDTTVTENSTNPITSGGVASYITPAQRAFVQDEYNKGLNLLSPTAFSSIYTVNNITVSVQSDGGLTVTTSNSNDPYVYFKNAFTLTKTTRVTLSADNYSNIQQFGICTNNTTSFIVQSTGAVTVELPAGTYGIGIETYNGARNLYYIMLNEGSTALPYQPYNGGKIAHMGDVEPVLLWEESNKNAAQSSKNITVPNYRSYKYLVLEYKQWYSSSQPLYYQKIKIGNDLNGGIALCCTAVNSSENLSVMRSIQYPSLSSGSQTFTIYDCSANSQVDNNRLILTAIYGTNVL